MRFSAINSSGPVYLSELLHVYTPSRTYTLLLTDPQDKLQIYTRKTRGIHIFFYFGPHIWNSLPQDLRHSSTHHLLKSN